MEEILKQAVETISIIASFFYNVFGFLLAFYRQYQEAILPIAKIVFGLLIVFILFKLFVETWLFYRRTIYKNDLEWTLLEILIPREVMKTPRAMEQFFMNLHGLRNAAGDFLEKYIDGEVTKWWSLEIVSYGGEVHFFIRTVKGHKKMVEAALYAQYPTVEVIEVPDYMDNFPQSTREIYQKGFNIFGGELMLRKEDAYPITTYERFELSKDEMAIDPISALFEVLGGLGKEETVFIQILVQPADAEWQEPGKKLVEKLTGREKKEEAKRGGVKGGATEWTKNLLFAPVEHPTWIDAKKEEKKDEKFKMESLTPGERDIIKAIEENISKPGFNSLIRYLYYAPTAVFSTNFARRGLIGAFNQYASQALNSFRGNPQVETRSRWIYFPHVFVSKRVEARRQRIIYNYRNRKLPEESFLAKVYTSHPLNFNTKSKTFVLNTAELATIFHIPPEQVLTAPHTKRVESKKMGPPSGLPIYTEEDKT